MCLNNFKCLFRYTHSSEVGITMLMHVNGAVVNYSYHHWSVSIELHSSNVPLLNSKLKPLCLCMLHFMGKISVI